MQICGNARNMCIYIHTYIHTYIHVLYSSLACKDISSGRRIRSSVLSSLSIMLTSFPQAHDCRVEKRKSELTSQPAHYSAIFLLDDRDANRFYITVAATG